MLKKWKILWSCVGFFFWPVDRTYEKEKYGSLKLLRRKKHRSQEAPDLIIVPDLSFVTLTGGGSGVQKGWKMLSRGVDLGYVPNVSASIRSSWNPADQKRLFLTQAPGRL